MNKTIYSLIQKVFRNNLSDGIYLLFQRWFVNNADRKEKEEALITIWESIPLVPDESAYRDWVTLQKRIQIEDNVSERRFLRLILRVAAILLLPLLGGLATYYFMPSTSVFIEPEWKDCFVSNGNRDQIMLADSSEVWLNSGSLLLYSVESRRKNRVVYLKGEASFNVTADAEKPFIVKTSHADIKVVGTHFNVEAYPDTELIKVTLEKGKVMVNIDNKNEPVLLRPNEQLVYNHNNGLLSKQKIDAERVLQWKHGYLFFQSASFDYIMKSLERRFDVTINYESAEYTGRLFTLKFKPEEDLTQILNILKEMIPGMNYKIKEEVIYITS